MDKRVQLVLRETDINQLRQIPDCHRDNDEEPALTDFVTEIQKTKRVVSVPRRLVYISRLPSHTAETDNNSINGKER